MMFQATAIIALVAALVSNAQAAAVGAGSNVEARQPNPRCPSNNTLCGWNLIDYCGDTAQELHALNRTISFSDVWNSIYRVDATGEPVEYILKCTSGCSSFPDRPQTECN